MSIQSSKRSERSGKLARRRKTTLGKPTRTVKGPPPALVPATVKIVIRLKHRRALPILLALGHTSLPSGMPLPVLDKCLQANTVAEWTRCIRQAMDKAGMRLIHTHPTDKVAHRCRIAVALRILACTKANGMIAHNSCNPKPNLRLARLLQVPSSLSLHRAR